MSVRIRPALLYGVYGVVAAHLPVTETAAVRICLDTLMKLDELLPQLKQFPFILVTGPQRSGTRIASTIIAADLNYPMLPEEHHGTHHLWNIFLETKNRKQCVFHGPALSAYCHLVPPEMAVVFMMRDLAEIHESEQRVNWHVYHEREEAMKYFSEPPAAEKVYECWEKYQKANKLYKFTWFELEYTSLDKHPLWIPKEGRKNFLWHQTK